MVIDKKSFLLEMKRDEKIDDVVNTYHYSDGFGLLGIQNGKYVINVTFYVYDITCMSPNSLSPMFILVVKHRIILNSVLCFGIHNH